MARTTKEEAQKTRQKLIETAIELFYERGVSATSLEHIAEASGHTRGAIYWHFKNKADLIEALHEHFHMSILETLNRELMDQNKPPLARIKNSWLSFLQQLAANDMHKKTLSIFVFKCDYSGELAGLLTRQMEKKHEAHQLITDCFQSAIDRGDLPAGSSAQLLTQCQLCFMHGIVREYLVGGAVKRLETEAEALVNFFFGQLPTNTQITHT